MTNLKFAIQLINNISIDNAINICSYLNLDIQLIILNKLYLNPGIDEYDIECIGYEIDNTMAKMLYNQEEFNFYCNGCFKLDCKDCNEKNIQRLDDYKNKIIFE
jgi:hypothetical protein